MLPSLRPYSPPLLIVSRLSRARLAISATMTAAAMLSATTTMRSTHRGVPFATAGKRVTGAGARTEGREASRQTSRSPPPQRSLDCGWAAARPAHRAWASRSTGTTSARRGFPQVFIKQIASLTVTRTARRDDPASRFGRRSARRARGVKRARTFGREGPWKARFAAAGARAAER
jgi:hypothetical protein